jgi:hypothetical protein
MPRRRHWLGCECNELRRRRLRWVCHYCCSIWEIDRGDCRVVPPRNDGEVAIVGEVASSRRAPMTGMPLLLFNLEIAASFLLAMTVRLLRRETAPRNDDVRVELFITLP